MLIWISITSFHSSRLDLQLFGTYFPFERIDKGNSTRWGAFKWLSLMELDYENNFLFRKFDNLNGYPLKVSMFPRYPTALTVDEIPDVFLSSYFMDILKDSCGYGGVDGLILGNMARALNFTAVVVTPNGSDFGYRQGNGAFIGKYVCQSAKLNQNFD